MTTKPESLQCSFCGKGYVRVAKLVAGPGVYICNECVQLCHEIMEEEAAFIPRDTDAPADPEEFLSRWVAAIDRQDDKRVRAAKELLEDLLRSLSS